MSYYVSSIYEELYCPEIHEIIVCAINTSLLQNKLACWEKKTVGKCTLRSNGVDNPL